MAVHIKEFNIGAFKGIKDLSLKELNHINILTGDNNTGKTSILELLYTLNNPSDMKYWIPIHRVMFTRTKGLYYNCILNSFPLNSNNIEYRYTDDENNDEHSVILNRSIENHLMSNKDINSIEQPYKYIKLQDSNEENEEENDILNDVKRMLVSVICDSKVKNYWDIFDFQSKLPVMNSLVYHYENVIYVSPVAHAEKLKIDKLLLDTNLHNDMITILKEFDVDIEDIISIGENGRSYYMVRNKKFNEAIPLNFYGDGMKKALLLLSSMLESKDGILLIDEFETAIHTSAMDHIFSWLLNSAIKLNVQVFLTSHSKEAINKVLRCDESISDKISYYTLFNYEGKNLVRKLSCSEAIKLQDQGGMDIR